MSGTEWRYEDGRWSAPVGDGTTCAEVYDDELETLPPLVDARRERDEARAEAERLTAERDRLRAAIETHRTRVLKNVSSEYVPFDAEAALWAVLGEATDE